MQGIAPNGEDQAVSEDWVVGKFRKHGVHITEVTLSIANLAKIMSQRLKPMSGPKFERSKRLVRLIEQTLFELNAELADLDESDRQEPEAREHNATEREGIRQHIEAVKRLNEYQFVHRAHWLQADSNQRQRLLMVSVVEHILKEEARPNTYSDALRERIALDLLQESFEPALDARTLKQTVVRFRR